MIEFEIVFIGDKKLRFIFLEGEKWYAAVDLYQIVGYWIKDASRIRASSCNKKNLKIDDNTFTMVNKVGVKEFLLSSRKKTNSSLNQYFDVDINNSSLLCKESQIGTALSKAFKDLNIISQYKVNNDAEMYFIDFYLPDHRIAIEVDERNHDAPSSKKHDEFRQKFIERKLGCHFVRCNPDSKTFDIFDLIYEIRMNLIK